MVEYGGAINNGPAGQAAGSGGANLGSQPDVFASVGNVVNDTVNWVTALPPEMLVVGIVVFFVGLLVLRRAF